MATIYRFIVENKTSGGGGGRKSGSGDSGGTPKKTTAKKGRAVGWLSGGNGGVEHNRKMRAINPLLNKMTGGWWEKGTRLGRAGAGLVKVDSETGKFAGFSGPAIAIIIAFVIQAILRWQQKEIAKANQLNAQNFKMLENGVGAIHGEYSISVNLWNGRQTYNQNK